MEKNAIIEAIWLMLTSDAEQINKYLQDGYRAAKPPGCTKELYDLMTKCWEYNPENRPQTTYILQVMERAKQFQTNIF